MAPSGAFFMPAVNFRQKKHLSEGQVSKNNQV